MNAVQIKIEKIIDRIFPGLGFRPFFLTVVSATVLTMYWHWGAPNNAPLWFINTTANILRINDFTFYLHLWSHLMALIFLLCVPLVLSWIVGIRLGHLGFSIRHSSKGFAMVLLLWLFLLPFIWFASKTSAFQEMYPRLPNVETDVFLFVIYELFYLLKWIAWEFFFRGFMLFGFKNDLGNKAVLISTIPFTLMHFGKPEVEVYASLIMGFVFCWFALRFLSIWPVVILHWLIAVSMDLFTSTWWSA